MNDKLKQFYDAISQNPNIKGVPASYEEFATAMSDSSVSSSFYNAISSNSNIKGLPSSYDAFANGLGLKKKEPAQKAGGFGATPSRSASSGNLQEMLAAAPPLPADARLDVPIGAQPQRPQERAITTALPPIGNIPLRTEEQRTEERRALYEPSQVSKRLSNFAVEMTTVLPAIEQWQTQAGNAMLGRFAGKEANEAERAMMIAQEINLQDLESKLQEGTEGEIIQSIKKGDIPALAYGIFDASMGILRSGIVGGLTMGAGVIPDMIAQNSRSFNKSKAEALGVTPEQLIEQGKEEVAIPTIIGAIGGSLELVGLKGITSAITKKIGTKLGQQVATGLMGTGGEGITEWTQAGLERANESLGKGKSVADATNDAVELMFSEEGLEAALKGMTGAGATIAAGRGIRALTSAKAKIDAGQPITAQEAQEIAVANIESNGAVAAALENMVNLGAINQEQAQIIGAEMEAMSNAAGKVPNAMAASAPQLAPIILEKQNIDARIAELNVEMATKDESFAPLYKMEIRDLEARKTQLNEQIQAVITPQAQQQVTEAGEAASPITAQAGAVVEGVQEGGVDTRIANSPLAEVVNKRGVITDANGNLVEGDVYVEGERVVLEAGGRIYDTLGSIDELSQMTAEQLPVQVVAPRITATEGGFTYNSSEGVMPQGTRVTPQGTGLKAVKRDKNGNVKSVVVKDDAGNTFNLKGEDAQAMAFELMMDEISKGNLDAKIVLNDEAATAINTAGRPATTQAADSGATQADATRQGAATPTTATERGDGGRGSRVEATQETEVDNVAQKASISPKNLRDLYKVNRELFGLNKVQSLASSIAMDRMIGTMANRAGISKSDMYGRLKFEKASETNVPQGVLLQVDAWHGSPYQFDKFTTEKIGTGEGAQAFGWGLYFTDLEGIARNYANRLGGYEKSVKALNTTEGAKAMILDALDSNEGDLEKSKSYLNNIIKDVSNRINKYYKGELRYSGEKWFEETLLEEEQDIKDAISNIDNVKKDKNLYKVSLQRGKTPDQYTWLEWDKQIGRAKIRAFINALSKSSENFKNLYANNYISELENGLYDNLTGKDFYTGFAKSALQKIGKRTDKDVSLALLESGIDGVKYPAESIARGATTDTARGSNYVVFDENAVSIDEVIKFQKDAEKARGAAMVSMDGQAVIYALTDPNVSTPLHELAHVYEHYLTDAEKSEVQKWAKTKGWTIETSEKFARGFEKYLSEGNAPTNALQKIFEQFKQWLGEIYNGINDSDIDVKINAKMKSIYDNMFGKDAKTEKAGGKDAAKEPSTEGVDARKQAEDGERVGKQDAKGKEAAQEGEVADKPKTPKDRLEEVRDRKKAAMEVLKTQWQNAKNTGISTDFEQRLKDDKAFFGAIRDIIQSNIEIGALKITDSLNDIADALGIKLSKADKDAVKGVFNKEVLRSLKSEQAERFETEAVRDALSEYIEENKQVLKGAANAQALKLVNESSTEAGFIRAVKYIDKLIDSAEFREAVNAATDAVSKAPEKLSGFAQIGGLVKAIAKIKVRGIEDLALLKKMAEILSKPTKNAPFELQNLVNEVNDYLTKKADPKGLSTQEDVLKEFKKITTERVKNEEGEIETRPKTLDTARKIKNYAQRIAEIEAAMIDVVQDEAVMEDLRAKIEAEKTRINEASVKLKEEMEESRIQNILFTKAIINVAKAGDMFSDAMYKASIKPIQQTKGWEKIIDSADYYTSVKYRNAFEAVAAGYLPRYLFRDITIPLTNFGKVEGAIALSEAAKPKIKDAAKEVDTQPKAFNSFSELVSDAFGLGKPKDRGLLGKGKQLTKKDIVEKIQSKYAQQIDAMYGLENEAVFLDNFLAPAQNAFEAKDNAVQSVMDKFYKDAGISQASMILDATRNTKLESFYKVFYHLLQNEATANGKSENILKEQLDLIKDSSVKSSIPDFKLKIIERISNKYPDGVSDKNLTIGEKKMVKAFKDALNTLKPLQEQANIRRGLDFNAVSEYVPHMALDYSFTPRDIRGETVDFEQTDSMISDTSNVQYKNPKIKSDRGISRVETPTPFVYNPDITTILGVSANQVLTDYYLFPQIYGANRAFTEATKATGSAMPDALRTRYGQMIRMQGVGFKGKAFRAVGGVLKAAYANVLARPIRIAQEMIGGIFNYKATGKHGKITRLPKDLKDALMLSKDGSYKAILDLARKDAYTDVVEFEDGLLEKAKSIGKKAFDVGTSPDAINDGTYRRAHMVSSMRDKFKEITGEDINFNKAASDPEYQAQYKDALKEASTYAYNQTYVKYYSKGRLARPARPLSLFGHYLYDTTSQGDIAVLADRMLFVFGNFAHKSSQLFHQRLRDGATNNNYGRTIALSSVGGFLMTAVSYQLVKEFRNYLTGDDEEKKKAEFRFKTTMTSPDYYAGQVFSAFWFFAMGQYGSIGRGMAYLAAYEYSRTIKEYKNKFSEESFAKLESSNRAINNAVKDLTFYELPSTDYGFKSKWLEVTLGGGSFLAEEASKIINEVSNLALDAANGDVDAQKAMYVAGFLYNATLSQRTGITIPMLKDLRDREKNLTDQQMTPEALKKKLNKDSRYASQIFEDVALKAALEVVNNEKSNEEAFNDAYELISQALPDMDEEDRDSKLTKQFTKMLMPTYLHAIDKEQSPEVRGLMFREKRDEVLKSLNEAVRVGNDANIDKYEKMQQELETYYLENYDNEKFVEGFSIPDAKGN